MILQTKTYHDLSSAAQQAFVDPLAKQGFRYLSLAIYGDPANPMYAGTLVLRDQVIAQRTYFALSLAELQEKLVEMNKLNLALSLISVTGPAEKPLFAVVFDPGPAEIAQHALIGKDRPAFEQGCNDARSRGEILRSAVMYGKPGNRRFAAVWWPNPNKVIWQVYTDTNLTDTQQIFDAMMSQYGRPILLARSDDGQYLSAYRGDAIGDAIGDIVAVGELSSAAYAKRVSDLSKKYIPVYVQAIGGPNQTNHFSVIFATSDEPLARQLTAAGTNVPGLKQLDDLLEAVLKHGGGRTVTCAVAHEGQVIYQRSLTWAEPGYPVAQADSLFRVASCSKALTAIVAHQLFDRGVLTAEDFVQPILKLTPPPKMKFSGDPKTLASWVDKIQVKHLLNHTSGLTHGGPSVADVATAFGHPNDYKLTKREYLSLALCSMGFAPGTGSEYSNTGYVLLGMVIEAKAKQLLGPSVETYEQAVQGLLLKPLNIRTAQIGKSLAKDRAPHEVVYQTNTLEVQRSQMSSDRPFVASQYGAGGDAMLLDAAGEWIISSGDYVRVLTCLDSPTAAPIFKNAATKNALLNCGMWEEVHPFQNGKNSKGQNVHSYSKVGGMGGSTATVHWREDHFSIAAFLAYDVWPSDDFMSLANIPATWAAFQLNERINKFNGVS